MDINELVFEHCQFENCRYQWSNEMTKLLMEEIRRHISALNNKNYSQRELWKQIAINLEKRGYNVSDEQCRVKWYNLKQKYKSVHHANNETGNAKVSWEYFDLIDELMNTAPEVTPTSLASDTRGFRLREENVCKRANGEHDDENTVPGTSHGTTRNVRKRSRKYNALAYWEKLYKQRETHHKDIMEIHNKFLTLLKNIYNVVD